MPLDFLPHWGYIIGMEIIRRKLGKRRHSKELRARLRPEQDDLIREAAGIAGITLSDWMRERLTKAARREIAEARRLSGKS